MKKVYQITTSIQENGLFMSSAIVQITNGEIKDFVVPDMSPDLIQAVGRTDEEAKQNLKKVLDLEGIDYKYIKF